MPKQKKAQRHRRVRCEQLITPQQRHRLSQRKITALIGLLLLLGVSGGILAQWRFAPVASRTALIAPLPTPTPSPLHLAKEYIYAAGKLVATEEPSNISTLVTAPAALIANTNSESLINLSWTPSNGPVDHYEIDKTGATQLITATSSTFSDTNVTPNVAYLYKVRAVDAFGNVSPYSNIDLATAITFDNDPLTSPPAAKVNITAEHLFQLRRAVNAVRNLAGLTNAAWTHTHYPTHGRIYAKDVEELRTNLDQALSALNLPVQSYLDSSLTNVRIKKDHFQQLRDRVR